MSDLIFFFVLRRKDEVSLPFMSTSLHSVLNSFNALLDDKLRDSVFMKDVYLGYIGLFDTATCQLISVDPVFVPYPSYVDSDGVSFVDPSLILLPEFRYWFNRVPFLFDSDSAYELSKTSEVDEDEA